MMTSDTNKVGQFMLKSSNDSAIIEKQPTDILYLTLAQHIK